VKPPGRLAKTRQRPDFKRSGVRGRARAPAQLSRATAEEERYRILAAASLARQEAPIPRTDGSGPVNSWIWLVDAFMLEAIARDALGDLAASDRAVERALDCTKHAALIAEILNRFPGSR
jgi:hypothetical protein